MMPSVQPERAGLASAQGRPLLFERGLIGFPEWRNFIISPVTTGPTGVQTLRCVDPGGPTFLVVDARRVKADYRVRLSANDLRALQLTDPDDALVLGLVGLQDGGQVTINLLGPLVINPRLGLGRQVVMCTSSLSARCPIDEEGRA